MAVSTIVKQIIQHFIQNIFKKIRDVLLLRTDLRTKYSGSILNVFEFIEINVYCTVIHSDIHSCSCTACVEQEPGAISILEMLNCLVFLNRSNLGVFNINIQHLANVLISMYMAIFSVKRKDLKMIIHCHQLV